MKEIGGYFELDFNRYRSYHSGAIALNTGRNCLEYILRIKRIEKILIPHYTCDVLLEPIMKLGIDFAYYHIDPNLEPILASQTLKKDRFILYTNYFGIKQNYIKKLFSQYRNIIIDNCHGFYHYPIEGIDTFYSARKFFGVPDGAYLYTESHLPENEIEQDFAFDRSAHLIKRIEMGADEGYQLFLENDQRLYNQPIRRMSLFSRSILESIDYESTKNKRERNFLCLHDSLSDNNEFKVDIQDLAGPCFYPFLKEHDKIRQALIDRKIYVPTFWRNVISTTNKGDYEQYLANFLLPLPIDQRYDLKDMQYIIKLLQRFI